MPSTDSANAQPLLRSLPETVLWEVVLGSLPQCASLPSRLAPRIFFLRMQLCPASSRIAPRSQSLVESHPGDTLSDRFLRSLCASLTLGYRLSDYFPGVPQPKLKPLSLYTKLRDENSQSLKPKMQGDGPDIWGPKKMHITREPQTMASNNGGRGETHRVTSQKYIPASELQPAPARPGDIKPAS